VKDKSPRHDVLIELLKEKKYSKQSDVVSALKRLGYVVTQASVSRDFTELGIDKVGGRYMPRSELGGQGEFGGLVSGIEYASPFLSVVKTSAGAASIVAAKLDKRSIAGVLGTIAGDDTIFVATKNKTAQNQLKHIFLGHL
jgi:transcriptional regulator of arginine metabolism